jgi:hypothetical protein
MRNRRPGWILPGAVIGLGFLVAAGGGVADRVLRSRGAADPCAPTPLAPTMTDPEHLAALADAVWADPQAMDCTLSRAGLDRRSFMRRVDEIQRDPAMAERYARARRLSAGP